MVEDAGKGMKGKDEAGGVVDNRGLMNQVCLPEGIYPPRKISVVRRMDWKGGLGGMERGQVRQGKKTR